MLRLWAGGFQRAAACAAALGLLCAGAAAAGAAVPCVGDCDRSGVVGINELVLAVNIALGGNTLSACRAFDLANGVIVPPIDQLVLAINDALEGCPPLPTTAGIVFNGEDNRLNAYRPTTGFPKQTVIPSNADKPGGVGRDLNGQICFTRGPQGQVRLIGGEDTNQGAGHATAGWGFFDLSGELQVGSIQYQEIGKLIPTYQSTADEAENYGCGFLSDGRLLTTDVGNQMSGSPNGQLIIWFPPLDTGVNFTPTGVVPITPVHYCKLDIAIGTAQQIAIDGQDHVYVNSARPGANPGVYRYTGPFPTSDRPDGGCDGTDDTGAPMATHVTKELFIPMDGNIVTPSGIVLKPGGGFYIASVLTGTIAEYDAEGHFVRKVLDPPSFALPIPTGTPLGLGLASDGTLYYADIGLVSDGGFGPGDHTGSVRRIRFVDGVPQAPETMDTGLNFPDGIGILELPLPTATPSIGNERRPTATPRPTRTPLPT